MEGFRSIASHITNKMGLTDSGETSAPDPATAAGEDLSKSMGDPEPSPDVLQGRNQGEPRSPRIDRESSGHDARRGESPRRMATARPTVAGDASSRPKEDRHTSTIQRMDREIAKLKRDLEMMTRHVSHWHNETMRCQSEINTSRTNLELAQREISKASKHTETLVKENTQLGELLETRRQELQDAQRFMGTEDTFAESEVVQEVHGLNTEIFNLARSMADGAVPVQNKDMKRAASEEIIHALGRPFVSVLESTDPQGDTILLEIAIQAAATRFLAWIISTWTRKAESDSVLSSIYERIRRSENQSVAGQWRALTRKFAQAEQVSARQQEDSYRQKLVTLLQHVAALSRMRTPSERDPRELVQILVSKAFKIRHLIGEAMKSSEYEILLKQPGAAFVAEDMKDVYCPRGKGKRTGLSVLYCASLGLRRVEKVEGGLRSTTLVKPDVGLQTLVEDLGLADGGDVKMSG
ncbi:uncharacterized protein B0H18DRAFT_1119792 [Fomitopsis serialis]|uniref:uncharacterized protein n=1 Tax=Fomitopsis serialis TaxID=139415 RepID=UPI0020073CFC|nr:uncharacterized protein B0H18DRAFT_1119792 [Neoantrodia serialis]KAH9924776.1 hypothetical protein B0H18DRAFT_1119792 [Neoantrodia serialis]